MLFIIAICFSLIILLHHYVRRKSHPPGPFGFPIVGLLPYHLIEAIFSNYLPKVSRLKFFLQMKKKYGDYWSFEMGRQKFVVLASWDIANEAFANHGQLFSGRPRTEIYKLITEFKGILFSNDEIWKENRQMAIKALKEYGMGKKDLEYKIMDEGNQLINYLESISSFPIKSSTSFIKTVSNVISRLVFNESNNYDDPEFDFYVQKLNIAAQSNVITTKCSIFPKLSLSKFGRFIFSDVDEYIEAWSYCKEFVEDKCKNKRKLQNKTISPDCVFDYFWKYRYHKDLNIKDDEKLHEIFISMLDLYSAGSETSNSFLIFSCLMLGCYQNLQNDLRKELRHLTEDHITINMDMKKDCPKLSSFMDEIHRFCCVAPKIFRSVIEPCTFMGYKLYPNDIIFGDLFTISRDPNLFSNPDVFDPYRFMDSSKTRYIPNKSLIPFGIGKRICPGEAIANMEIFLILSRIIHRFHITIPKKSLNNIDEIIDGHVGITHGSLHHEINIQIAH